VVSHQPVILIVEDDESLRALWRTALRLEAFDVVEAGDGLDALKLVEASPPDLVVLDLGLPHVDGVSVREDLAAQFFSRTIPIVVITGSNADLSRLGVSCVLRKPVTVDQVVRVVRQCMPSPTPMVGT
jgi:CheY-like chemotaxis protein